LESVGRSRAGRRFGHSLELDFVRGGGEDLLHHTGLDFLKAARYGLRLIRLGLILSVKILIVHTRIDLERVEKGERIIFMVGWGGLVSPFSDGEGWIA
jgi:hypothetical protein